MDFWVQACTEGESKPVLTFINHHSACMHVYTWHALKGSLSIKMVLISIVCNGVSSYHHATQAGKGRPARSHTIRSYESAWKKVCEKKSTHCSKHTSKWWMTMILTGSEDLMHKKLLNRLAWTACRKACAQCAVPSHRFCCRLPTQVLKQEAAFKIHQF